MFRFSVFVAVSAFAILLMAASGAWAYNITILDTVNNTAAEPGPTGVGFEDNEVERDDGPPVTNMQTGQAWDLEAFLFDVTKDGSGNITKRTLTMVGGWDFFDGLQGWRSGDVFLATSLPYFGATIANIPGGLTRYKEAACITPWATGAYVKDQFGYAVALDIDWENHATIANADGSFNVSYRAMDLVLNSTVELAVYPGTPYNLGSNPYRVNAGGTYDRTATFREYTGVDAGGAYTGSTHYSVRFDFTAAEWTAAHLPAAANLWTHFTMGCGNDLMEGKITDTNVPEPMSMVMLGCLGAGMLGARKVRQLRKAAK